MADKRKRKAVEQEDRPLSHEEMRRRRKKRTRLLMWKRLVLVVAVALTAWLVWSNWDTMAPDKLFARLQDLISDASGTYPVDISGSNVQQLVRSQTYNVTLSDSYLTYYNDKGGEVTRYPCTYSSASLRTAGKYVLVVEQGGKRLLLTTRSAQVKDMTLDQTVLTAAVNSKGQMAVLTQGTQGYAVELTVYDKNGEVLYSRKRATLASDVTLSADGKTVAVLSVEAVGGVVNTSVEAFSLSSTDTQAAFRYTATDTLLYRLNFLDNKHLTAVGESGAVLVPLDGKDTALYPITGQQLLGYAVANNSVALAVRPMGDTHGGSVIVLDKSGKETARVSFDGEFRQLSEKDSQYLLLTSNIAQVVKQNGAGRSATVEADGQQAVLSGNRAIVLGLSAIQEYEME